MKVMFSKDSWNEYLEWQQEDQTILKKINELIKDISRNGLLKGLGKPEKLKFSDCYSRRIKHEHRLVYLEDSNGNLLIISCKHHYQDK